MCTKLTCVELFYRCVLDGDLYVRSVVKGILYFPFNWILLPCVLHVVPVTMSAVSVPFVVLGVSDEKQDICHRKVLNSLEMVWNVLFRSCVYNHLN